MKTQMILVCAGILVLSGCGLSSAQNQQSEQRAFSEREILDMLLEHYERMIRPKTANGTAIRVQINLHIGMISRVDDENMEFAVQMFFRQEWNDDRLAFDANQTKYLSIPDPDRIWKPDIYFSNEKTGYLHNLMVPNQMVRVDADGNILMSTRVSLVLACQMDLRLFPMDQQICDIRFESYALSNSKIDLVWKQSPIEVAPIVSIPRFKLIRVVEGENVVLTATETYKCLKVSLFLQRTVSFYVKQFYIPTIILVFISWIPFWLDPEAVTARITLGTMTLLAMVAFDVLGSQIAPVPYTTAIGIWTGFCLAFIILALLEHATVNFLNKSNRERQRRVTVIDQNVAGKPLLSERVVEDKDSTPPALADKLDFFSRIVFPVLFLIFNILYWSIAMSL